MSSGLMSAARLVKSTPRLLNAVAEPGASDASTPVLSVLLSIGRPSMIISGWLLLLIELTPRMVIDDEAPGTPDVLVTSTPATRPCSALTKFSRCVSRDVGAANGLLGGSEGSAAWAVSPSAVTTTSLRVVATLPSAKSCVTSSSVRHGHRDALRRVADSARGEDACSRRRSGNRVSTVSAC